MVATGAPTSGRGPADPARIRVGCSGWLYRDWRGLVYPAGLKTREWFEYYTTLFDTVELNTTFYRLPSAVTVETWEAAAPPGFVYALKLGQFGSHRMKLRDAGSWLPNHLDRARRLGVALGPTLVQLPPRWTRNTERLDEFLAEANRLAGDLRWAVELRDPSWLHGDTYEVLRHHRAALCLHDMIPDHPFELTTDWTYLRFHGPDARHRRYQGRYTGRRLWRRAERLAEWVAGGCDVYAYFNNDYEGHAVTDARWLADRFHPPRAPGWGDLDA